MKPVLSLLVLLLTTGACRDEQHPTLGPAQSAGVAVGDDQNIPTRAEDPARGTAEVSDDALWTVISDGGNTALVGLKAPGRRRGVWRSRILVSQSEWGTGRQAVLGLPGITLVRDLPVLPILQVRIADSASLRQLRQLPFVDYVEPSNPRKPKELAAPSRGTAAPSGARFSMSSESSGCRVPENYSSGFAGQTEHGDYLSFSFGPNYNRVTDAWRRSQGDNILVALLDTGMDPDQAQFTNSSYFNPRPWEYSRVFQDATVVEDCGHGTRMAGVIAAPNDGRGIAGTAWKSDFRMLDVGDDPTWTEPLNAYDGITYAMGVTRFTCYSYPCVVAPFPGEAKIIAMAFRTGSGSLFSHYDDTYAGAYSVADLIRYFYWRTDSSGRRNGPLFIAAIGTMNFALGYPTAIFPAEMPEVVAVVAIRSDGTRDLNSNYGAKAELAGYIPQASVDVPRKWGYQGITQIRGSSGAAASVAGIAALAWSRYPHLTNVQIREHLRNSAAHPEQRRDEDGYGPLNAHKAVGGMYKAENDAPPVWPTYYQLGPYDYSDVAVNAFPYGGDGPYSYYWHHNGATTPSTTVRVYGNQTTVYVSVTITDHSDGVSHTGTKEILVNNSSCTTCPL